MAERHRLTELPSGLRIVTEAMPSVRSVSLGYWVGTGSRTETPAQAGLSHFLEHLLFKGTARFSSFEVDEIFDAMGADLNAATSKETTSVYARVPGRRLERAIDVIADMVWAPAFADVDTERAVVLEEIAMSEDLPEEKVYDVLAEAVFGPDPLGRPIIGRAEVIAGTPVGDIAAFHASRYVPGNVVLSAAGAVEHERLVELAAASLPSVAAAGPARAPRASRPPGTLAPRTRFERKDTEQFHVCLGGRGLSYGDERRFALRLLDTMLGGAASSRLFREIRELRGLAYSVHSFVASYDGTGQIGLYVGTRRDHLAQALEVIAAELARIREEPIGAAELERAKENHKGRIDLSLESTSARMNHLGSSVRHDLPLLSVEEIGARIDAVSAEDIRALAAELLAPERLSAAGIGPDEAPFRAALEPLGAGLAVAA